MTKQLSDGPSANGNIPQKATTSSKPKKSKAKKNSVGQNEDLAKSEPISSSLPDTKDPSSAAETSQSPVKMKKKSSKQQADQAEEDNMVVESSKKSKKRKNREIDSELASRAKEDTPEPSKKKHKNRTEFADPRSDTTLNSQSRKGLEYAFLQMNKPSKWKFNKARQNWLIRNVWNSEAISDTYFPFVLQYLVNVQGGSREKLKETCETYINPPKPTEVVTTEPTESPSTAPKSILKPSVPTTTTKAGPLIAATPVPGALISVDSISQSETVDAKPKLADNQKKRAQMLLEALGVVVDSKAEV